MRQIIWRWKAAAKPLLPYVESFSNSLWLKSNLENRKISQTVKLLVSVINIETAPIFEKKTIKFRKPKN